MKDRPTKKLKKVNVPVTKKPKYPACTAWPSYSAHTNKGISYRDHANESTYSFRMLSRRRDLGSSIHFRGTGHRFYSLGYMNRNSGQILNEKKRVNIVNQDPSQLILASDPHYLWGWPRQALRRKIWFPSKYHRVDLSRKASMSLDWTYLHVSDYGA